MTVCTVRWYKSVNHQRFCQTFSIMATVPVCFRPLWILFCKLISRAVLYLIYLYLHLSAMICWTNQKQPLLTLLVILFISSTWIVFSRNCTTWYNTHTYTVQKISSKQTHTNTLKYIKIRLEALTRMTAWCSHLFICTFFSWKGLTEKDIFKLRIKETIRRPSFSLHRLKPPLGFQEGSRQN